MRMTLSEALPVQLVEHGVVPRHDGSSIITPIEIGADHQRTGYERRTVALVAHARGGIARVVAQYFGCEHEVADDRLGIGIEQQLVRIAAMSGSGVPGPVHSVAVTLPRSHVG